MRRNCELVEAVLLCFLSGTACRVDDDGLTSPSSPIAHSLGASEPLGLGVSLSGQVVDSVTGQPIAGARLQAGNAVVETDASGLFTLPPSLAGVLPIQVDASGHLPRETFVQLGVPSRIAIDLIPEREKFDLGFFDHVYRELGEDGTHRWASEPAFQILDHVLDCVELDYRGYCDVFQATEGAAAEQFATLVQRVIVEDVSRYTGGHITGVNVTRVGIAPGTRIVREDAWVRDTVRFVLVELPNDFSWASMWYYHGSGSLYSGLVMINSRHKGLRGVYSHELAHAVGYFHPRGEVEVPLLSIMRYGHGDGPEPNDILHGAILYRRPSGSRTPDRDPQDFVLNALRGEGASGELVERIIN